jgi:DNA-binding XRE family transcriptional regulator
MGRSFDEIMARRDARLSPEAREYRKALEQAYGLASQVIGLRLELGLTQAELAERCGVDQGDISRIERGETSPTTTTLQRIADALGAELRLVKRAS